MNRRPGKYMIKHIIQWSELNYFYWATENRFWQVFISKVLWIWTTERRILFDDNYLFEERFSNRNTYYLHTLTIHVIHQNILIWEKSLYLHWKKKVNKSLSLTSKSNGNWVITKDNIFLVIYQLYGFMNK